MKKTDYYINRVEIGFDDKNEPVFVEEKILLPMISKQERKIFLEKYKLAKDNKTTHEITEDIVKKLHKNFKFKTIRSEEKQEIWVQINNVYKPCGRSIIQQFCRNLMGSRYVENMVNQVVDKIVADTFIEMDLFFNYPNKDCIVVQNGVLNLKNRKLSKTCGEQIHFNALPVKYDPTATCKLIDKFYSDVFQHKSDIETMHEINGYCLYKDAFLEKAIMLKGKERNGKTKTLDVTMNLLGTANTAKLTLHRLEQDKTSIKYVLNKLANLAGDISNEPLKDNSTFKMLIGRENIQAFRKFKDDIDGKPYCKHIFATNQLPLIEDEAGFWSKWVLLDFPYTFILPNLYDKVVKETPNDEKNLIKKADPFIIEKICTFNELSGLLNKALDGLDRLLKNKGFTTAQSGLEVQKLWIRNSNSFAAYALDNLQKRPNYYILPDELNRCYTEYCEITGSIQVSSREITKVMKTCFGSINTTKRFNSEIDRYWTHVKFKSQKDKKEDSNKNMTISIPYEINMSDLDGKSGRQTTIG